MLDEIKAAQIAVRAAHAALKDAARGSEEASGLLDQHGLSLRRLESDLGELHSTEAESAYLGERAGQ